MSIRTKLILVSILALAINLGIGLYAIDAHIRAKTKAIQVLDHSSSVVSNSLTAQVHFKKQVQEWKNVLLRGHEGELYGKYLQQFFDEEKRTREAIDRLLALTVHPDAERTARQFLTAHQNLGRKYREALSHYRPSDTDGYRKVDRMVRGIDRQPTDLLDRVVEAALEGRVQRLARIDETIAREEHNILITVIVALTGSVLLLVWLIDRSVGRPIIAATAVAQRISEGNLSNVITIAGNDEAARLFNSLDTMQASLVSYQKNLRESKERIQLLLDSSGEGIYGVDQHGNCSFCNPASAQMLGYGDPACLLGRNIHNQIHHSHVDGSPYPEQECKAAASYHGGQPVHVDNEVFWRADGSCFPVEYRSHPICQGEHLIGAVVTFSDITARKKTEQELQVAHAALQQERSLLARRVEERTKELHLANTELVRSARTKDEFLATMSHELRTPLTTVVGISEMFVDQIYGPLNEQQIKGAETINESGHHLLSLINDILDVAKIGAGKMQLAWDLVPVEQLCEASLRLIRQSAQRKKLDVSFKMDPQISVVNGDSLRLKQLLVNLLSNAVKFTPEGKSIGLDVTGWPDRGRLCLSVWDRGIGIPEDQLHKLFKPFVQLDSGLSRYYSGTGLGLALVYSIAELHGGSVTVDSTPGQGTRINVYLSWEPDAERLPDAGGSGGEAPEKSTDDRPFKQAHILLADDSRTNASMLSSYLEHMGYQVTTVQDGVEAVAAAQQSTPDIVLMDIQLNSMDGLEATRRMRASDALRETPIIALTALAMPGDRERCLEAGANDYLSKPLGVKELHRIIQDWLSSGNV